MRPPEFRKAACCLNCRNRHRMATRWCLKYPNSWGGRRDGLRGVRVPG